MALRRDGYPWALWNRDAGPEDGNGNTYGSHPIVWVQHKGAHRGGSVGVHTRPLHTDGRVHAYVLMSSNAMDVVATRHRLTFRTVGGVVDLRVLPGPTPEMVNRQLVQVIGRLAMPPRWALGFHQCKYGYTSVKELRSVVEGYAAARLPLDVMWTDIDYMNGRRDFTFDPVKFAAKDMSALVDDLHMARQRWVPIVDPAIKVETGYKPYESGKREDVWMRDATGQPLLGVMWPGVSHWPDFSSQRTARWWTSQLDAFYETLDFDGIWLVRWWCHGSQPPPPPPRCVLQDMNEVSNFQSDPHPYDACFLPDTTADHVAPMDLECYTIAQLERNYSFTKAQKQAVDPPYAVNNARHNVALGMHTMSPAAQRLDGNLEYNTHQLYGLSQVAATFAALRHITSGRPFVLSRSSFLGV